MIYTYKPILVCVSEFLTLLVEEFITMLVYILYKEVDSSLEIQVTKLL